MNIVLNMESYSVYQNRAAYIIYNMCKYISETYSYKMFFDKKNITTL